MAVGGEGITPTTSLPSDPEEFGAKDARGPRKLMHMCGSNGLILFPVLSQPWFSELGRLSQTMVNLPANHSQTICCGIYPSGSSLRFVPFSPLLSFLCPIFGLNLSPSAQPSPRSTPRNPPSFPLWGPEKAPSFWFGAGPRAPIVSTQNRNGWWHGQGIAWQVAKEHWGDGRRSKRREPRGWEMAVDWLPAKGWTGPPLLSGRGEVRTLILQETTGLAWPVKRG